MGSATKNLSERCCTVPRGAQPTDTSWQSLCSTLFIVGCNSKTSFEFFRRGLSVVRSSYSKINVSLTGKIKVLP